VTCAAVVETVALNSLGQASYTTSGLNSWNDRIVAIYTGSANYVISNSTTLAQTVDKDGTSVALTPSNDPSTFGQPVTFTDTVVGASKGSGIPTGTITFYDETKVLGTAMVDSTGTATFAISRLTVGTHNITATYSGDAHYWHVKPAVLVQTVNGSGGPMLELLFGSPLNKDAIEAPSLAAPAVFRRNTHPGARVKTP
jgi:Big-like domain-containing protein